MSVFFGIIELDRRRRLLIECMAAKAILRPRLLLTYPKLTCSISRMSTTRTTDIAPPPIDREMKTLDRSFFKQTVRTTVLAVPNVRDLQMVRKTVSSTGDILATSRIRPVVVIKDDIFKELKCILLHPRVKFSDPSTWKEPWQQLVEQGVALMRPYNLEITYDDWSVSDILGAILPELSDANAENHPSGYAQVGHVAHVNLRAQYLPYKYLIAQVLLDKAQNIRTVINKVQDVGTESIFRTFPYEVLAGPDDMDVTVSQAGCEFKFNFAEVYWNSRNSTEQERLLAKFKPGEAICDITAGVGPFACPAGKQGIWVWANDLNPACYMALEAGIKHNNVAQFVKAFNTDGHEFIRQSASMLLRSQRSWTKKSKVFIPPGADHSIRSEFLAKAQASTKVFVEPPTFDHFISNLPSIGIEFLPSFHGIYHGHEHLFSPEGNRNLPMIHTYTFQARKDTEEEEKEELQKRLSEYVGYELGQDDEVELFRSRLVSPNKFYYCASFRLPAAVAFASPVGTQENITEISASNPVHQ